jgi:hypothetical protein
MTECNQSSFGFQACGSRESREIVARFDGGTISSDGGALLLRQTDRRLNLLPRLAECFLDGREQERVQHSVQEMISQRVYGLALGYEDVNDHEQLRSDPLFGVLAGREEVDRPLAGKSTLNRLELGDGTEDRYKKITFWKQGLDELMVSVFLESQEKPAEEIVLDVDTTDLPLHGEQEGRFFHGYYDSYCYLPLYIFCGEQVLCARLRQSNSDAYAGSLREIERIVQQIRAVWPEVKIILRADCGFCRNELMSWCEAHGVDFVLGLARNQRLRRIIGWQMWEASEEWKRTGQRARGFTEFSYQARKTKKGVGPGAAGGGQSRAPGRQGESALRGHLAEPRTMGSAGVVRSTLLRAGRHGEPHQGAALLVCGSGQCGDDAGQSAAAVLFGDGLCVGERVAAIGAEGDGAGPGAGVDDPYQAAEDWRPSPGDGPQGLGVNGLQLSVESSKSGVRMASPSESKWVEHRHSADVQERQRFFEGPDGPNWIIVP